MLTLAAGAAVIAAQLAGCKARSPAPPAPRAAASAPAVRAPDEPTTRVPVASLIGEASRAELDAGGVVIDLGAPDQHKYTRGGWMTGWGPPATDADGTTAASVAQETARLHVLTAGDPQVHTVVLRARSAVPGQTVELLIDGRRVGIAAVASRWTVTEMPIGRPGITAGWHEIALAFARPGGGVERALVDWVWLKAAAAPPSPPLAPRVLPLNLRGVTRRALVAPTPGSYSFYIDLPRRAALRFAYGAATATTFVVRAEPDGGPRQELFRATSTPRAWASASVDLRGLGGRVVRLQLATEGPAGVAGWGEPEVLAPAGHRPPPSAPRAAPSPRNVIIVLLDAVRADVIGPPSPGAPVAAPALERFARQALVFRTAYSGVNWTRPAIATLLSGLYPQTHGVRANPDRLSPAVPTLPQHLKTAGFATAAFTASPQISVASGLDRGWDVLQSDERQRGSRVRVKHAPDRLLADALAWARANESRHFLLYVHLMGAHLPYEFRDGCTQLHHPERYGGTFGRSITPNDLAHLNMGDARPTPADVRWIRALYHGEVTCQDAALGRFLEGLEGAGLLRSSLVVLASDHGEALLEHGALGHMSTLFEEETRTVLALRFAPRLPAGTVLDDVVEHVDVTPTILELLGVAPLAADGESLMPLVRGAASVRTRTALLETGRGRAARAVRVGRFKLLVVDASLGLPLLPPRPPAPPGEGAGPQLPSTPPGAQASGAGEASDARLAAALARTPAPVGVHLYDLEDDPGETRDRAAVLPLARRYCEIHLAEALAVPARRARNDAGGGPRGFPAGRVALDATLRRQLEALGYLGE
jgi:arylsulfatase A-like enzyme